MPLLDELLEGVEYVLLLLDEEEDELLLEGVEYVLLFLLGEVLLSYVFPLLLAGAVADELLLL